MFKQREDRFLKKTIRWVFIALVVAMVLNMLFLASVALAGQSESNAQKPWCKANGGELEVKLGNKEIGKVSADCVLDDDEKAIEFDFGNKYTACAGQAILYAELKSYSAVCVLIRKETYKDKTWSNYIKRFNIINNRVNPKIELICVNEEGGEIKC